MIKNYMSGKPVPPHELILANQNMLKINWLHIRSEDSDNYEIAKAKSPEAEHEFLASIEERNRIEAENRPKNSILLAIQSLAKITVRLDSSGDNWK